MKIRIAIPNKGRLMGPSRELLEKAGIKLGDGNSLFIETNNPDIDVISVRVEDIPEFIEDGAANLGFVGRDLVAEKGVKVRELLPLNFGYCSLVLAVDKDSGIKSIRDLRDGTRIATKFVNITKAYLKKNNKKAEIVQLSGAVEVAPVIGVADVIVDLTSTGSTLRTHGLKPIDVLLDSQAVLICNKESEGKEAINDVLLAIRGVVDAEKRKYLMVNLPEKAIPELERTTRGLLSPTITKLDKKGWVAAQIVVEEKAIFSIIKNLKAIGGRDILVAPIERLVR
jgi:ATP phosphoribosyltransferase